MSVLDDFDTWKDFLSSRLEQSEAKGMDQHTVSNVAYEVGDYLSQHVDAKNEEQALLSELWNVASEEEKQSLANTMVKLVQDK